MAGMSGMSGNNGLDNKPYRSGDGVGGGFGGAAQYPSACNIHNLKGCHVNDSDNTNIDTRINRTHRYMTNATTVTTATTATMITSASYDLNGLNINTDMYQVITQMTIQ